MSSITIQPPVEALVFEQIEAAVAETSRGRWFLEEFAKRRRHADTLQILAAIETVQRSIGAHGAAMPLDRIQIDILDMARAIARTEREIRAMRAPGDRAAQFGTASDELDSVVSTTERATTNILAAAEKVQELAWTMRERNGEAAECDLLDASATEIYTACGFQDLTAQRIRKVTDTLRFLDSRLKSIITAAGLSNELLSEADASPSSGFSAGPGSSDIWMSEAHQAEIDETFEFFVPAEQSEPTMIGADLLGLDMDVPNPGVPARPSLEEPPAPARRSLAAQDDLDTITRLRAFR